MFRSVNFELGTMAPRFRDAKQTRCLEILSAIGAYLDSMRWSGTLVAHANLLSMAPVAINP